MIDSAGELSVPRARSRRETRGGTCRGTADAAPSLLSVSASEIWWFTAFSCRHNDAAIRHNPSRSVMKIGSFVVRRRGENTSSGTQSGALPVTAICAAARPAAVV